MDLNILIFENIKPYFLFTESLSPNSDIPFYNSINKLKSDINSKVEAFKLQLDELNNKMQKELDKEKDSLEKYF